MMENFSKMTNLELKRYLSEHRNNDEKFRTALEVLMNRQDPATEQPYPFDLKNPETQVEALLKEKLSQFE
jgi:hypothetical protein